jgi:hypothetical protein
VVAYRCIHVYSFILHAVHVMCLQHRCMAMGGVGGEECVCVVGGASWYVCATGERTQAVLHSE